MHGLPQLRTFLYSHGCPEPWGKDIPRLSMTERELKFLGLPRWDLDALFLGDFAYSGGG